jgi:hypothetical protein
VWTTVSYCANYGRSFSQPVSLGFESLWDSWPYFSYSRDSCGFVCGWQLSVLACLFKHLLHYWCRPVCIRNRNSSVGIALSNGLDDRDFETRRGLGIFLFITSSRLALVPTLLPIQGVQWAISLGVKRPGCEAGHSPPSRTRGANLHSSYMLSWRGTRGTGTMLPLPIYKKIQTILNLYMYCVNKTLLSFSTWLELNMNVTKSQFIICHSLKSRDSRPHHDGMMHQLVRNCFWISGRLLSIGHI